MGGAAARYNPPRDERYPGHEIPYDWEANA